MKLELIDESDVIDRKPYHISSGVVVKRIKRKRAEEEKRLSGARKIVTLSGLTRYIDD